MSDSLLLAGFLLLTVSVSYVIVLWFSVKIHWPEPETPLAALLERRSRSHVEARAIKLYVLVRPLLSQWGMSEDQISRWVLRRVWWWFWRGCLIQSLDHVNWFCAPQLIAGQPKKLY